MDKRTNIKTVAELAGVSISTVSRVLNHSAAVSDRLREKVYSAIRDTGYSINPIASTLKSTRRNQIAIVIPSLRQTYYTDIIKGISDYCYERDVMPVILESSGEFEKEKRIIARLEKQWVDGIIFIPSKNERQEGYREFQESLCSLSKNREHIPVALLEADNPRGALDCVSVDYRYAFSMLTKHILEIGRRKIAYLSGPQEASMYEPGLEGVREALAESGCELSEKYLISSGFTVLDGYNSMNTLFQREIKIDGVVCANDQMAAGALRACCERDIRIPEEIVLAGFGGVALSVITTPPITTMIIPRYEMGCHVAKLLFERIDGVREETGTFLMKPSLAIRGSTLKTAFKRVDAMFAE